MKLILPPTPEMSEKTTAGKVLNGMYTYGAVDRPTQLICIWIFNCMSTYEEKKQGNLLCMERTFFQNAFFKISKDSFK